MIDILKVHKKIAVITFIAILGSMLVHFLTEDEHDYPKPTITGEEAQETAQKFLNERDYIYSGNLNMTEAIANKDLSRYMDAELDHVAFQKVQERIPIYTIKVTDYLQSIHVDPFENKVIGMENLYVNIHSEEEIDQFVHDHFGSEYNFIDYQDVNKIDFDLQFSEFYQVRYTYEGPFHIEGLHEQIIVDVAIPEASDDPSLYITGFMHGAEVPPEYTSDAQQDELMMLISAVIILLILGVLGIATLIHFIVRASKRKVALLLPLLITAFFSVFSLIFVYVYMGNLEWLSWIEVLTGAWFVFFILAMTIPQDTQWMHERTTSVSIVGETLSRMKKPIILGLCLAVIGTFMSDLFFWMTFTYGGAWFSPVTFYEIFMLEMIWLLPLFVLAIGITAAIMEETLFRRYLASVLDHIHPIFAVLVSSFLWAILHLAYDVHPWYLRIVELTLIIGPFLYWIYKRYGFLTVLFCHYFFNSLYMSIHLFTFRGDIALVSIFLTLSPLMILLYKQREKDIYHSEETMHIL